MTCSCVMFVFPESIVWALKSINSTCVGLFGAHRSDMFSIQVRAGLCVETVQKEF